MAFRVSKFLVASIICVSGLTWSGLAVPQAAQTTVQAGTPTPEEVAERLAKVFDALETAGKEIPRDTFDPKVVIHGQREAGIEGTGTDPRAIFAWVRDNTYMVPYRGVLRNHQGVLMDRVGNSLDRALLLLVLLYEAGHDTLRLAHAELSDDKAAELLERAGRIPEEGALPRRERSPDEQGQELMRYADQLGLGKGELRQMIDEWYLASQRLREDAAARTVEQSERIMEMLQEKDLVPSRDEQMDRLHADAIEALQHHWWVQWRNGSDWVDLDPSLPDARPGTSFVSMESIVPGNELSERLANELHTVQIRLVIERWVNGRLEEAPVLTQELFPANLLGEGIAIHHAPARWPEDLGLLDAEEPLVTLKQVALDQDEWVPVLTVGDARIAKYSFTDTGLINDPSLPDFVQSAMAGRQFSEGMESGIQGMAKSIGSMLSSGTIRSPDKYAGGTSRNPETYEDLETSSPTGTAQLTAEWIEYEIRVPGQRPRTVRRQIFDLLGPAARQAARQAGQEGERVPAPELSSDQRLNRSFALLGQTEILAVTGQLSPEYVGCMQVEALLDNREPTLALVRALGSQDYITVRQKAREVSPFPSEVYALVLARQEWGARRPDLYADQINIFTRHEYMNATAQNDFSMHWAFDIVDNEVAVRSSSEMNPFLVRLKQGVMDTNAETLLAEGSRRAESAAALFRISRTNDIEWILIERNTASMLENNSMPDDISARMRRDLFNNRIVIAPRSTIKRGGHQQFGWWRVDPESGSALGIGEQGWGQTSVEYTGTLRFSVDQAEVVYDYLNCMLSNFGEAMSPSEAGFEHAQCWVGAYGGSAERKLKGELGLSLPLPIGVGLLKKVLGDVLSPEGLALAIRKD